MSGPVAVIGAGWAGCAAAVSLAQRGHTVTLFEAARTLGGRARQVELHGQMLDNGQHILLGAYRDTLRLLRQVGIDPATALLRLPLQMRYPGTTGMDFLAPKLPAPLHLLVALLRTRGLSGADKLALARFSSALRWMGWQINHDCSVTELLERFDQTAHLVQLMWRPLCLAALNTPPERASAQIFLNVLKDSLGARRGASDMLLPRCNLSALFPQSAAKFVEKHGGTVMTGARVHAIARDQNAWQLMWYPAGAAASRATFAHIVLATEVRTAATLLAPLTNVDALRNFTFEPITTCYLQYEKDCRLDQPFYALVDDLEAKRPGQFVFDRGQLEPQHAGLLAVVISASNAILESSHSELAAAAARQLAATLQLPALATPQWSRVITEKRATFTCSPRLMRPENRSVLSGIVLAGDYTAGPYPATLEAAVRSGLAAATLTAASS